MRLDLDLRLFRLSIGLLMFDSSTTRRRMFWKIASFLLILGVKDIANATAKDCKTSKLGKDYQGNLAFTKSGRVCQRWDSQSPHRHSRANMLGGPARNHVNYCRNPDNEPNGPWCYTTDPAKRWEYCNVRMCDVGCKKTKLGKQYRGHIAHTKSGTTCQRWDLQYPHKHSRNRMLDGDVADHVNYCRNPDNEPNGPWCYTTSSRKRWEYCNVNTCGSENEICFTNLGCKRTARGREYRGTLSFTKSGRQCQRWDTQSPHKHTRNRMLSGSPKKHVNYCRNPDNEPRGPWCYTTDPNKRWEYCDVNTCSSSNAGRACLQRTGCKTTKLGKEYRGVLAFSKSGRRCQRWDTQYPHKHSRDRMLHGYARYHVNYCRNPDNSSGGPWCYTTDPHKRWEYCNVPLC